MPEFFVADQERFNSETGGVKFFEGFEKLNRVLFMIPINSASGDFGHRIDFIIFYAKISSMSWLSIAEIQRRPPGHVVDTYCWGCKLRDDCALHKELISPDYSSLNKVESILKPLLVQGRQSIEWPKFWDSAWDRLRVHCTEYPKISKSRETTVVGEFFA